MMGPATKLVLAFALSASAQPEEVARDFQAANERALAKEHGQAIALYESILERGYDDSDVYYNLGHVLEGAGRPIDAIVAYERALARAPGDADAIFNLERLRALHVSGLPEPAADAASLGEAVRPWISSDLTREAAWLFALSLLAACVLRAFFARVGAGTALANLGFFTATISLVVTLLGISALREVRAVVTESAALREGPDARFPDRGVVIPGETVRVRGTQGSFQEIQRLDGSTGFVERAALATVTYSL